MCLVKNNEATEKFRKKNKNKKEVVVWKIYCVNDNRVSPIIYDNGCVNPGRIESNRTNKHHDNDNYDDEINRGIHVYLSRRVARKKGGYRLKVHQNGHRGLDFLCIRFSLEKIFRCTAKMSDLVAVGGYSNDRHDEAVFMKIHISPEDFERGKKGRN